VPASGSTTRSVLAISERRWSGARCAYFSVMLTFAWPGIRVDPHGEITASPYFNPDLAPTTTAQRKWRLRDMAALWVAMAACVPTYMLASSLIDEGMNWWQAVLTIVLANIIVLVPMILNGHAGTKYGIPFPVYCRAAFGLRGANVPALLRALVAC